MIINVQNAKWNDKVYNRLMTTYMPMFTQEYSISNQFDHDIMKSHQGRTLFCEWLGDKEILNVKSWELTLDTTYSKNVGGGFNVNEDGLLTRFLLEC